MIVIKIILLKLIFWFIVFSCVFYALMAWFFKGKPFLYSLAHMVDGIAKALRKKDWQERTKRKDL